MNGSEIFVLVLCTFFGLLVLVERTELFVIDFLDDLVFYFFELRVIGCL